MSAKGRTVLVKCLIVDSDGFPVNGHGEMLHAGENPIYEWEPRYRTHEWMRRHPKLWKDRKSILGGKA